MTTLLPALERALPDRDAWSARLLDAEIPVLATTAHELETLRAEEDRVDANGLGELISRDPLMTLKVLAHAARSMSTRVVTDVETVTAALVMMGIPPFFKAFGPQLAIEDALADRPDALAALQRILQRARRAANFALGFAGHRMDPHAPVIHAAALLHDFVEMLLWFHAPGLAMEIVAAQRADPSLRSSVAQRRVLNVELSELQQSLMKAWRLPRLLIRLSDDRHADHADVRMVALATRLARHTADGWDNAAIPDDIESIADLLNLSPSATLGLVRSI